MKATEFLTKLKNINREKLLDLHGVGTVLADNLIEFVESERFDYLLRQFGDLEQNHPNQSLNILESKSTIIDGSLSGEIICITGTFDLPRSVLRQQLEEQGAKTTDNVTKQTTILLAGEDAGSKLDKAKKLNIRVVFTLAEIYA